jgi:hypothetical protein
MLDIPPMGGSGIEEATQTDQTEQLQKSVETETDPFYLDPPTKPKCRDLIVYAPPNYYPFSSIYIKQQFHYQYLISQAFNSHLMAEGMAECQIFTFTPRANRNMC